MQPQMTQTFPRPPITMKLIAGLFFTALGILITADNLDLFEAEPVLLWWPVVLIAAGLVKLTGGGSRVAAVILLVVGTSFLLTNLGLIAFTIFDLWPLLLIGGGLFMVSRAFGVPAPRQKEIRADAIHATAVFAERKIASAARDFSGGNIFAVMSSCEIDLTDADIVSGPATINATAIWAGIEVYVPDTWDVIGEVTPFMGGFEVKAGSSSDPSKKLIIRGLALMAGIEVKTRRSS